MHLTENENRQINELARRLEIRTGVQFQAAVVGKCDTYPEIPWKAFALGASMSALAGAVFHLIKPDWFFPWTRLPSLIWILAAGALIAVLTPFWPALARLFLDKERAEGESLQYAQGLFLEQELFRTPQRTAILMLIGLLERQVVLLPDSGLHSRLKPGQLDAVIDCMLPQLRRGDHFKALKNGITRLEEALQTLNFEGDPNAPDLIPDELVQQKGAES